MMDPRDNDIPTAGSRLLSVPELLSAIIGCVHRNWLSRSDLSGSPILSCLTVSPTWETETRKYLWRRCGGGGRAALVRDLVAIKGKRQQMYADIIEDLSFSSDVPPMDDPTELVHLNFPRLIIANLNSSTHGKRPDSCHLPESSQKSPALVRYLNHGLMVLRFRLCWTDHFMLELTNRCPRLQVLTTEGENRAESYESLSPTTLATCLQGLPFLTSLHLHEKMPGISHPDFLSYLAQHQSIRKFQGGLILESWAETIASLERPGQSLFPKLQSLTATISSRALELVLPYLKNIRLLDLDGVKSSRRDPDRDQRPLKGFVGHRFEDLTNVEMSLYKGSCLDAIDLAPFAKSAPNLIRFDITLIGGGNIPCKNLTDQAFRGFARGLPYLSIIYFVPKQPRLTEDALLWLFYYCRALDYCELRAKVNFETLVKYAPRMGQLDILTIHGEGVSKCRNTKETAAKLVELIPYLTYLSAHQNVAIQDAVRDIIGHECDTEPGEPADESEDEQSGGEPTHVHRNGRIVHLRTGRSIQMTKWVRATDT